MGSKASLKQYCERHNGEYSESTEPKKPHPDAVHSEEETHAKCELDSGSTIRYNNKESGTTIRYNSKVGYENEVFTVDGSEYTYDEVNFRMIHGNPEEDIIELG